MKSKRGGWEMTRHEFIGGLREALAEEMPGEGIPRRVIDENVRFYNRYIDDELAKGRSENDIFAELGDPRLIAKTISETWQSDDTSLEDDEDRSGGYGRSYGSGSRGGVFRDDGEYAGGGADGQGGPFIHINGRNVNMNKWYIKAIPIVVVALIVLFIFWVLFGLLHLTFAILTSPVFWVIVVLVMVSSIFFKRK